MDPLERWLSGDAIQPKPRSDWEHVAHWIRKHPRVSSLAVALLVSAVVVPIGLFYAYSHTAESLRAATVACSAAEQERLELSAAVSRNAAEMKMHQDRWQSQQQEHEWLKNQFRALQSNYQQSQQQIRIAENLLHGTIRESLQAPAEQTSVPAQEVQHDPPEAGPVPVQVTQPNPPAASPVPAQEVQHDPPEAGPAPAQVTQPNPPAASPVPAQEVQHDPPAASPLPAQQVQHNPREAGPVPAQEVQRNPPAAGPVSAQEVQHNPPAASPLPAQQVQHSPREAGPVSAQLVQHDPPAASSLPAQEVQPNPPEVNPVPVQVVQHDPPQATVLLIREVQHDPLETSLVPAAQALNITLPEERPPIPAAEQQVQDLMAPLAEMESRGHNDPVFWQKTGSELFRLE